MMNAIFHVFIVFLILFLIEGCISNGQISKKEFKNRSELILLAWNEDTIHNYQFSLLKNQQFANTIIDMDSLQTTKTYYGKCINQSSNDTLFLKYNRNHGILEFENYLVRDADNHYLIQHLANSSKLAFLRLQNLSLR